jgi:hypothetical protein
MIPHFPSPHHTHILLRGRIKIKTIFHLILIRIRGTFNYRRGKEMKRGEMLDKNRLTLMPNPV